MKRTPLTIRERSLAALIERGFSRELAARAFTTLLQYVVGSAVTQAGSPALVEAAAIRDYYRSLDAAAFPHVAAAAEALTRTPLEAGFVEGLEIVLGGIDRIRRRRARSPASGRAGANLSGRRPTVVTGRPGGYRLPAPCVLSARAAGAGSGRRRARD